MRTITVKGEFIRKEAEAAGAITPGHLIEDDGNGDVIVHATAAGEGRKAFALENSLIGDGIDDDYADGDTVQYGVFTQGAEVYAFLAAGENAGIGDALVSNGDGTLAVMGTGEEAVIMAWAMEAVDNSAGSDAERITVEVA